jgi:hypothetical protein
MRHRFIAPVSRPFDPEALAATFFSEFGQSALTMSRKLLVLAEGEARINWQKIVLVLEEKTA